MLGFSLPAPPASAHDLVSHLWPLIFLLLILMIGKRFFREHRKLQVLALVAFLPLLVWGPYLFRELDKALGEPQGKIFSYLRYEFRIFTNKEGKEIEAAILDVAEDEVTIRRADGKEFRNPISSYSEEDQEYIRNWKSRR